MHTAARAPTTTRRRPQPHPGRAPSAWATRSSRLAPLVTAVPVLASLFAASPDAWADRAPPSVSRTLATATAPVTLITAPEGAPPWVCVRLEADLGPSREGPGTWGRAAALAAALAHGDSPALDGATAGVVARHAGLRGRPHVGRDSVAMEWTGPAASLDTALWLARDRLRVLPPGPEDAEPLVRIRDGLWDGAAETRRGAVLPAGSPLEVAIAELLGPRLGHGAFGSRVRAESLDDAELRDLVEGALSEATWHVFVTGPGTSDQLEAAVAARFEQATSPGSHAPPAALPSAASVAPPRRPEPPAVRRMRHGRDGRLWIAAAWDLRGVSELAQLGPVETEALWRVVSALLAHPGGTTAVEIVDDHGFARRIDVRHHEDARAPGGGPLALAVGAEVQGDDPGEARRRLVSAVEALADRAPSIADIKAAAAVATTRLLAELYAPSSRTRLAARAVRTGRAPVGTGWGPWLSALLASVEQARPARLTRLASWALLPARRLIVELAPQTGGPRRGPALDGDTVALFTAIAVDARCAPGGPPPDLADVLTTKYRLTPAEYVAIARRIAETPRLQRDVARDVAERCDEYEKLATVLPLGEVPRLHEALACGPGSIDDRSRRRQAVARVFRRFDLDPSVYRPLLLWASEDLTTRAALEAIDARCPAAHGPASRR